MNGGQVLMNYAKTQGVNVNTFNPAKSQWERLFKMFEKITNQT